LDRAICSVLPIHPGASAVHIDQRDQRAARAHPRAGPQVDPARMGYPVLAFVFLQLTQGRLAEAAPSG
jgi:hypothetical protein